MASSKHLYNLNPVLNKWEEENYARLMERKVRGARSTGYSGRSTSPKRTRGSPTRSSSSQHHSPAQATQLPEALILQQLKDLPKLMQLLHKQQQQGAPAGGQSDTDTALTGDCDTTPAAAAAAKATSDPTELLGCLAEATGPLAALLQQLVTAHPAADRNTKEPQLKVSARPPCPEDQAAGDHCYSLSPSTGPSQGSSRSPGVAAGSAKAHSSAGPKSATSSSNRGGQTASPNSLRSHKVTPAVQQQQPARRAARSKPAWDDNYREPPPVGFAGFQPLVKTTAAAEPCPAARHKQHIKPENQQAHKHQGTSPKTKACNSSRLPPKPVGSCSTAAAAPQAASVLHLAGRPKSIPAAPPAPAARRLQQADRGAATAARPGAQQRHASHSSRPQPGRMPVTTATPAAAAAAVATASGDGGGSSLLLCLAPTATTAAALRYINCRDTDDLSYRESHCVAPTCTEEARDAASSDRLATAAPADALSITWQAAASTHDSMPGPCINQQQQQQPQQMMIQQSRAGRGAQCFDGLHLPLVQHLNRCSSSDNSHCCSSSEKHTWGSSHCSSRSHSGNARQQQEQQQLVLGGLGYTHAVFALTEPPRESSGAAAGAGGDAGAAAAGSLQGCCIHRPALSPSLDLIGLGVQLQHSDLLLGGCSSGSWSSHMAAAATSDGAPATATAMAVAAAVGDAGVPGPAVPEGCSIGEQQQQPVGPMSTARQAQRGTAPQLPAAGAAAGVTPLGSCRVQRAGLAAAVLQAECVVNAGWELSASVLQCCSDDEGVEYADDVWEGED